MKPSDPTELIVPPAPRTTGGWSHRRRELPDDILREASRRLGIAALLLAVLWTAGAVLTRLSVRALTGGAGPGMDLGGDDLIVATNVVISLALFRYTRGADRDPRLVLDLGLVYMIATAFSLGVMMHFARLPVAWTVAPVITWTGPIVLMFAAIAPSTPGKMLVAGLVAVSMNPLSMAVAKLRGSWDFGPWSNVMVMHFPDFLLVIVAVAISHVMTRLGGQVTAARELGSYRLGKLLGRGGMGEVYLANHRMLARPAAIKLIRPDRTRAPDRAEHAVERFRREADVAASLRSPHTVELYDFGVTADRTFYFVMELLDGLDLDTLVRRKGPLPAARVVYLLRQVCDSLEEAHALGLVHRDIKPANIHVGRLGLRHDFVKVLDFGLVKILDREADGHLRSTADLTPGTPAFMAPEVATGEPYDGRSDLYGLGCVAYFLLTGQLVFDAANGLQMINKHVHDPPIPPSRRTEIPVPPELERIVLDCLAKQPDGRPDGAAELSRRLARVPGDPWDEEQASRWWAANQPTRPPGFAGD